MARPERRSPESEDRRSLLSYAKNSLQIFLATLRTAAFAFELTNNLSLGSSST